MHHGTEHPTSTTDTGKLERGLHQAGEGLHSTIERVVQPVHGAVERASATAHETVDRLTDGVAGAAQRVDARLEQIRATPNQALDSARAYVAERPLQSVALALAVGWLWGRLGAYR